MSKVVRKQADEVDLETYSQTAEEHPYEEDPSRLPSDDKGRMLEAGVVLDSSSQRSGTFLQIDHSVVHCKAAEEGLEVMASTGALEKYPWLSDYWWQAVAVDADKFTAEAERHQNYGYFIRALPGVKATQPVQACLYIGRHGLAQNVHNLIIAEEGSELHIITGCTIAPIVTEGLHIGVSEFYIKKGAKVTFTMIHNWAPKMAVRPRTGVVIEEGGVFLSNYICLKPVRTLQMYPTVRCVGENALVRFNNVLVATSGSKMDVGSRAILAARGARAEIISRAITTGGSIIARGHLVGQVADVKGHLECRGLILSEEGNIRAIPELDGQVAGVDLSHEAAVGKIAEEEVEYLMARGLSRSQAVAVIVRGFLSVDIEGLPPQIEAQLQRAIELSEKEIL
ncbi:MAG: SufD family Fe-S cluster assembly protein [Dehalococcoidia bacterium]|nr:SufD family Fe-S cluster assembly protein [Dehalococcoidia bacterium]